MEGRTKIPKYTYYFSEKKSSQIYTHKKFFKRQIISFMIDRHVSKYVLPVVPLWSLKMEERNIFLRMLKIVKLKKLKGFVSII